MTRWMLIGLLTASIATAQTRRPIYRPVYRPVRTDVRPSYSPRVPVKFPSRFDWNFAAPPGIGDALPKGNFGAFGDSYQLLTPPGYKVGQPAGLVLFLSANSTPDDFNAWASACKRYGLLYASPYGVGDGASAAERLRLSLAVLDDVRQRFNIDGDRVYIAGSSQGALTACQIAYSFPEFIGGLVAIGGATSMRAEPWMRERVKERVSVALVAGQLDVNRHMLERVRYATLKDSEVNSKLVIIPGMARGTPPPAVLEQVVGWLEIGRASRIISGKRNLSSRAADGTVAKPEAWAAAVVAEGKTRMSNRQTESGLMLLQGAMTRWPTTPAAQDAKKLLDEYDAKGRGTWLAVYERQQTKHFVREAQALDDYVQLLSGVRSLVTTPDLIEATISMWEQVEKFSPETRDGRKATARIEALKKMLIKREAKPGVR